MGKKYNPKKYLSKSELKEIKEEINKLIVRAKYTHDTKFILKALEALYKKHETNIHSNLLPYFFRGYVKVVSEHSSDVDSGNYDNKRLYFWIIRKLKRQLQYCNVRSLIVVIWAFAKINDESEDSQLLIGKVVARILNNLDKFNDQDLSIIIWAFACLDIKSSKLITECVGKVYFRDIDIQSAIRFIQAFTWFDVYDERAWDALNLIIANNQNPDLTVSSFEDQVEKILKEIGVSYKAQVEVIGYSIDFVVIIDKEYIALECDGLIYHKLPNNFRDKLLTKYGYKVVHLTNEEFNNAEDVFELISSKLLQ